MSLSSLGLSSSKPKSSDVFSIAVATAPATFPNNGNTFSPIAAPKSAAVADNLANSSDAVLFSSPKTLTFSSAASKAALLKAIFFCWSVSSFDVTPIDSA